MWRGEIKIILPVTIWRRSCSSPIQPREGAISVQWALPTVRADIRAAACGVLVSLSVRRLAVSCPSCETGWSAPLCCHAGLPSAFTCVRRRFPCPAARHRGFRAPPDLLLHPLPPAVWAVQGRLVGCRWGGWNDAVKYMPLALLSIPQRRSVLMCSRACVSAAGRVLQKHDIDPAACCRAGGDNGAARRVCVWVRDIKTLWGGCLSLSATTPSRGRNRRGTWRLHTDTFHSRLK